MDHENINFLFAKRKYVISCKKVLLYGIFMFDHSQTSNYETGCFGSKLSSKTLSESQSSRLLASQNKERERNANNCVDHGLQQLSRTKASQQMRRTPCFAKTACSHSESNFLKKHVSVDFERISKLATQTLPFNNRALSRAFVHLSKRFSHDDIDQCLPDSQWSIPMAIQN